MLRDPVADMHSDAWWMRVCEGTLSPQEEASWEAHLAQCESCRQEWAAMAQVDVFLRTATPPPMLAVEFTARTVERITHKQKLRQMLRFVVGALVLGLVAWIGWVYFGVALSSALNALVVMISGRQILFDAVTGVMQFGVKFRLGGIVLVTEFEILALADHVLIV